MFPSFAHFAYITDMLVVGVLCALLVIGGINPLDSPTLSAFLGASLVAAVLHRRYYARHRYEIEHDRARLAARERRGF